MNDFHAAMSAAHVSALWEQEARHAPVAEAPHAWRWASLSPLLDQAVRVTDMGNAERRVLVMNHPKFAGSDQRGANVNLSVNLQILMPGERARPHRHSMHALRFVLEGAGATTVVEGKACPMLPGDMVLTPAWTWHEHVHEGRERCVWIDALDVPVHEMMRTAEFEPGPARNVHPLPADDAFAAAGLAPLTHGLPYSPMFRYPWATAQAALAAVPPGSDGTRVLRYTNPATGGAVLTSIDCYLVRLTAGATTRAQRTNSHGVAIVVEGEGDLTSGASTLQWGRNDVVALPANQWTSWRARGTDATLFVVTDRELLARLGFLRVEMEV